MQQLVIKLGTHHSSAIPWILFDQNEQDTIAAGELSGAEQLSTLQDKAEQSEVICLIPACDVMGTHIDLPEKYNRKLLTAVHYMVEDKLALDVDSQFIAKGSVEQQKLPVIVIERERIHSYKRLLANAGLFCKKMFVDASLLPTPEDDAFSVVQVGEELLIKQDAHNASSGEVDWMFSALLSQATAQEKRINAYSELASQGENVTAENISFNYDKLPLELLLANIDAASINILQGEFAVKNNTNPTWHKWRLAAILAGIALIANIGVKTFELNSLKQERATLDQEITSLVKEGFPSIQRIRKATLKRTISQEIARLEATGGNASMLAMLTQMSSAFESTGVKPQALNFNSERAELRIQSVAQNFESLERFTREVSEMGLTVEQGAINNRGGQVIGVVVVKG